MELKKQKKNARKELLDNRLRLTEDEYIQKSSAIIERLREQPELQKAGTVHCYISMNSRKEVNTRPLIRDMLENKQKVKVVVPVMNMESLSLRHFELTGFDQLAANDWGVLEPQGGREVEVKELDLVIVPAVGADEQKNRMGYGKGFYDRFLKQVHCPKIGLVFECCLAERIPAGEFDVPLDKLITENRIIR